MRCTLGSIDDISGCTKLCPEKCRYYLCSAILQVGLIKYNTHKYSTTIFLLEYGRNNIDDSKKFAVGSGDMSRC